MVMACFGQTRAASSHLRAQRVGRLLLEHVQEVVVAHLEHLGRDAHAQRVALTLVEVDDDLEAHGALPMRRLSTVATSASGSDSSASRSGRASVASRRSHAAPTSPIQRAAPANWPGREPVHDPPPVTRALGQTRRLEHRECFTTAWRDTGQLRRDLARGRGREPEPLDDPAAGRIGERGEDAVRRGRGQADLGAARSTTRARRRSASRGPAATCRTADAGRASSSTNDGASSPSAGTHQNDEPARCVDLLDHARPAHLRDRRRAAARRARPRARRRRRGATGSDSHTSSGGAGQLDLAARRSGTSSVQLMGCTLALAVGLRSATMQLQTQHPEPSDRRRRCSAACSTSAG